MGLPNIGPLELIIILAIALLIVGPGRLPEMGNAIGRTIREFRKASTDISDAASIDPETKPAPETQPPSQPQPTAQAQPTTKAQPQPTTQAQPAPAPPAQAQPGTGEQTAGDVTDPPPTAGAATEARTDGDSDPAKPA